MSPVGEVAVAVTNTSGPIGKNGSVVLPFASVVTETDPTRLSPSPFPEGSQVSLAKYSIW